MANPCQSLCADIYRRHIYAPDGRMVAEYTNGQITRYRAEYFHQDHLGNTRLGFSDFNENGRVDLEEDDPNTPLNELEVTQESHYYPFGMNHLGPCFVRRSLTGVGGVRYGGAGE